MGIVFLGEILENKRIQAQEKQSLKCRSLVDPNTLEQLKELRDCLGMKTFNIQSGWRIQNIQRSYEGSLELVKQLNLIIKNNNTSDQLSEEPLNGNSDDTQKN